jgi:hypothetical protein
MNESILSDILRNITGGWYLDLRFLVKVLERHDIDFDDVMDSIEGNFWDDVKFDFNIIIYETLTLVAYKFLEELTEKVEDKKAEFEIFTNYMDSHIYFTDESIQSKFEGYF